MLASLFRAHRLNPALIFRVVLLLLGVCTVAGYQWVIHQEHVRISNAFNELAQLKSQRVQLRVDAYGRILLDLRGLFLADPSVSNDEFQRFLRGIEVTERQPALSHIGYAPRITQANRANLEGRLRALGVSDYHASTDDFPILYGYPAIPALLGKNLNRDHLRSQNLDLARDINQPRLSPLFQLHDGQVGHAIYLPLYGFAAAPVSAQARRAALSGYLFATFRTKDLIDSTIGVDLKKEMSLVLFDGPSPEAGRLAYDSRRVSPASDGAGRYTSIQHAMVGGRPWTFVFAALPSFVLATQSTLPLVVLLGGLLTSILGATLAYVGARRWQAERQIRDMAFHDELTGLPNRARLRTAILEAIRHERETRQPFALLIIELTRFRDINYTLGHLIGDAVLQQASLRIRGALGQEATLARISNVQFGVLLPNAGEDAAIELAQRLVAAMELPLPAHESKYELGARAGIATASGHGDDPDDLVRHADIALNRARTTGIAYVVYDAELDPYKPQRLALLGAFRQAIKEDQLELYCQPKADLRTGRISSMEALVRWQHPEFGLVMPDQFISLIEPTELIQLLTQRMLECAMRQCAQWRKSGLLLPLAVNLSTRNLLNPGLPELIAGLMKTFGANASWVGLEITESSIMDDPALSLRVLNRLHAMGLELIVDDFGTGYSSLSYLMKLPVDVIKIDQSFIRNMTTDADAAAIVKTVIELAHNMGMKVVAEGTETREVWDALKRLNCDEAQGYYISPPLPAHAVRGWLEQSAWQLARA
jgi:diguanylate cyclase (GGDEF)-like protein